MNGSQSEFRQLAGLLWRRKFILIVFGLLAAGASYSLSVLRPPLRKAVAVVLLVSTDSSSSLLGTTKKNKSALMNTKVRMRLERIYTEMLKAPRVLDAVIDELGLLKQVSRSIVHARLADRIHISLVDNNILRLTARAKNFEGAVSLADCYAKNLVGEICEMRVAIARKKRESLNLLLLEKTKARDVAAGNLRSFLEKHDISSVSDLAKNINSRCTELQISRTAKQLELQALLSSGDADESGQKLLRAEIALLKKAASNVEFVPAPKVAAGTKVSGPGPIRRRDIPRLFREESELIWKLGFARKSYLNVFLSAAQAAESEEDVAQGALVFKKAFRLTGRGSNAAFKSIACGLGAVILAAGVFLLNFQNGKVVSSQLPSC
jgi:capsular polysaccharide biosynthesis protein